MIKKEYGQLIDGFMPTIDEYLLKLKNEEIKLSIEGELCNYKYIPLLSMSEDEELVEYYEWCLFDELIKKYIVDNYINKTKGKINVNLCIEIRDDIIDSIYERCSYYNMAYEEVFNQYGIKVVLLFLVDTEKMTTEELDKFDSFVDVYCLKNVNELNDIYL